MLKQGKVKMPSNRRREDWNSWNYSELRHHFIAQMPMIAALLWEDQTAEEAARDAADLIEACMHEAQDFE
jgi:hypothetical protein